MVARTVAERLFADGSLGASFFCSKDLKDHCDLKLIFPTLAFQLALQYPGFRRQFVPIIQSNPDIVHASLRAQMEKFLVEPLRSADISTVIVIDALDECRDEGLESTILPVLGQLVSEIPGVKFFITSRPEMHITAGLCDPLLQSLTDVFVLHDVESHTVNNYIRCFFKRELSELTQRHSGIEGWPTDEHLDSFCRGAAGFFGYAVAVVNFIERKFQDPLDLLHMITESPERAIREGESGFKAYTGLEPLYMSVLQASFRRNGAEDDDMVRPILSAVALATTPLSLSAIATLLRFPRDQVLVFLKSIQSLLILPEDPDHPVQPFHKSFPDFITDPTCCTDLRFFISPDCHIRLALCCLELMDKLLKKNICSIPGNTLNSEVGDLSRKIEECGIRGALVDRGTSTSSWRNARPRM